MTEEQISVGAEMAHDVWLWVLFVRKPDMQAGKLRGLVAEIFGPEVDAELAKRYAQNTAPERGAGTP